MHLIKSPLILILLSLLISFANPVYATTYTIGFEKADNTGLRLPAALFPSGTFLNPSTGNLIPVQRTPYIEHGFEHGAIKV